MSVAMSGLRVEKIANAPAYEVCFLWSLEQMSREAMGVAVSSLKENLFQSMACCLRQH
jgi:hypothetical protein